MTGNGRPRRRIAATKTLGFAVAGVAVVLVAACAGDGGPPAPATSTVPTAPPTPPVVVAFVGETLEVTEGDAAEFAISYRTTGLPTSWQLRVTALAGTASEDDFTLSADTVQIPAGEARSGEVGLLFSAAADRLLSEENETVAIRFVPDPELPDARLGGDLVVVIREAGAVPCPGVRIQATPLTDRTIDGLGIDQRRSSVDVEISAAGAGTMLDFGGPFLDWEEIPGDYYPAMYIGEWRVEAAGGLTRHRFEIEWGDLAHLEDSNLKLGFLGGSCSGSTVVVCSTAGCELTP